MKEGGEASTGRLENSRCQPSSLRESAASEVDAHSGCSRTARTAYLLSRATAAPFKARFYWHLLAGFRRSRLFGGSLLRNHHRLIPITVSLRTASLSRVQRYRNSRNGRKLTDV